MYSSLFSCVKVHNTTDTNSAAKYRTNCQITISEFFQCNIGTRQGDKTSSTIFALFIDELSVMLRETCGSGIFISNEKPDILCLMFADDIASCAETAFKLQQQLNVADQFCINTGMEINLDKIEVIVFRNGGPLRNYERWTYRGTKLNTTSAYHGIIVYK